MSENNIASLKISDLQMQRRILEDEPENQNLNSQNKNLTLLKGTN